MERMMIWVKKVLAERTQLGLDQMDEVCTIRALVKAPGCGGQDQEHS